MLRRRGLSAVRVFATSRIRQSCFALLLACLLLSAFASQALAEDAEEVEYDFTMGEVMDGEVPGLSVHVSASGWSNEDVMATTFINETDEPIVVYVPLGMKMVPADATIQNMAIAEPLVLTIPAGESSQVMPAFCIEANDGWPGEEDTFSNGGLVDEDLLKRLQVLYDQDEVSDLGQIVVWEFTDPETSELDEVTDEQWAESGYDRDEVMGLIAQAAQGPESIEEEPADADEDDGGASEIADDGSAPWDQEDENTPAKKAGAGLVGGAIALTLSEVMRRMTKGWVNPELKGIIEEEADKRAKAEGVSTGEADEDDGEPIDYMPDPSEGMDDDEKPAGKPKAPPLPKAPKAGGADTPIVWDPQAKQLKLKLSGVLIEAGKGGGYIGNAPSDHDPFKEGPPAGISYQEGAVAVNKRGDQYDASVGTGKNKVDLYHDASKDVSQAQKGQFVARKEGSRLSMRDVIGGSKTGVSYDGSSGDFSAFRGDYKLFREQGMTGIGSKTGGGKTVGLAVGDNKSDFLAGVGDRWVGRKGDTWTYEWGSEGVKYDNEFSRVTYSAKTDKGQGSLEVMVGRESQYGVKRTQPISIKGRPARLSVAYEQYLQQTGGGESLTTDVSTQLDVGRVSVKWKPDSGGAEVRYNIKRF